MDFIAIDVETANSNFSSICQIGLVVFEGGHARGGWTSLIDPEDHFDPNNVAIHGIDRHAVADFPNFSRVYDRLRESLNGRVVAHHTAFDRISLLRSVEIRGLPSLDCRWLDTARVTRRAWPRFASSGYGLANVAQILGIDFRHHDAGEDARAAGEILVRAIHESGIALDAWPDSLANDAMRRADVTRQGDPDGPLAGDVVVFTGSLSMSRQQAADLAARAGCNVAANVTTKTTLLVVGDQDVRQLAGREKSNKHRKVEEMIVKGQAIRVIAENDFKRLINAD